MTSQQMADEILQEHQAARLRLAITRADALYNFYCAERRAGVDPLTANERMAEFAKRLDAQQSDLRVIRQAMERA